MAETRESFLYPIVERNMIDSQLLALADIEKKVCDIAADRLFISRSTISPASRLIEDLHCDSLDLIELIMALEDRFSVTIPTSDPTPVCAAIFTRKEFRLADLAEVIYLQQGTGKPERSMWRGTRPIPEVRIDIPFCQLGGAWDGKRDLPLFESLLKDGAFHQYRRRSDGMRCVMLPPATVEIGTDAPLFDRDSRPRHRIQLDSFLIDAETVSTTAYCRFLNTIGEVGHDNLRDWFLLTESDDRAEHLLIGKTDAGWQPTRGCEELPMILVSWYGANAYSLWANTKDWRSYRGEGSGEFDSFLPTEAQWEYAARGPEFKEYPWGNEPPSVERMRYGQHAVSATYTATSLPMDAVNATVGMSPFGLHHMAGNVWQWCRDWYDAQFYSRPEASERNAFNRSETGVRSERGGSWVGPAELCRSSHRRGRSPSARGRCLGFRCISDARDVKQSGTAGGSQFR
jgi:formylglycine-generating enzyme